MTRREFITEYCKRSGLEQYQNEDGYLVDGCDQELAVTCDCGEDGCEGWQMMSMRIFEQWEQDCPGRHRKNQ